MYSDNRDLALVWTSMETVRMLRGVLAWLKASWMCFGYGYHIHGTLKRLMGVLAWLKAWEIRFGHGYHIHGTLKRLMGVLAWLKAWWICILYPWDFEVADGCFGWA
ncbi:hypothetical protein C8R44DRAFT_737224 [Mycena epipterygia]|nr:hypothetical protein C8R44DRAFT_737224 [Mycena epipterygia]